MVLGFLLFPARAFAFGEAAELDEAAAAPGKAPGADRSRTAKVVLLCESRMC